nr:alpha-methylacyl-CoA racemase [Onthophagus taurus]
MAFSRMALNGLKVIEFAGLAPAPFCGMLLSDFGATVIRIDKIGGTLDTSLGHGKKSIALNLKNDTGREIAKKLCLKADVVLEPFRAGVMESLGLGPEVLLKGNPKLVYARLTGFGQKGYYHKRAGHDINYVAISGLLSMFGRKGENPMFPVNLAADFGGGGLMCAVGILLALVERSKSGLGQVVDANMVEGTAYLGSFLYRSQNLPIWGNPRGENVLDGGVHFYENYLTKDGKYMSVGALEPQFYAELIKGLGLSDDEAPQFGNIPELRKLFTEKFKSKTQKEWCDIFDSMDACVFPILTIDEAPVHQHNKEQKSFVMCKEMNRMVPNPAPKLSRTPGVSTCVNPPANLGEHTQEILKSLNFSSDEVLKLQRDGIVYNHIASKI